ncbi:hypothetical protein ACO0SA_002148 [Hanseniaspora valbyensis]
MSILPDFESSALSSLSQTNNVKRKLDVLEPPKNGNGTKSNDNNTEDNEEEVKNQRMKNKFLYKTLYNIQSLNTQSKQRKKYNKRIHSLVSKNPDSMIMVTEKLLPIILEKDFIDSRFHCFKLLSQLISFLPSNFLLTNGKLLERLWLGLVYLTLDKNIPLDEKDSSEKDEKENTAKDDVSDILKLESSKVLATLVQTIEFKAVLSLLKPYLDDELMLDPIAMTLSLCGLDDVGVLKFIHLLSKSKNWMHRFVSCKTIFFALQNGSDISNGFYLRELLECIKPILSDEEFANKMISSLTLNILISKIDSSSSSFSTTTNIFTLFENIILDDLVAQVKKNRGKLLAFQVRALASLIPFMDLELTTIYGKQVIDIITKEMNSSVIDMHLTILISIQRLLEAKKFMELHEFKEKLFDPFFTKFWTRQISLTGGKILKAVLFTTSMIAQKTGLIYVIERLVEHLKDKLESLRVMSVSVISRVLKDTPENIVTLPQNLEERLVDSLLIAFQEQKTGTNVFVKCFITLSEKLSKRLEPYLLPIISTGLNMMSNNNQLLRRNAAELCASMTHICANLGQKELVSKLGAVFYENLGEPIGDVLQHVVRCLAEVVRYTENLKKLQPPITQLLPTLTPILKNPHIGVCKNLLDLVGQISKRCSDMIPPREWNRVCNELLEIFKSPLKDIRVQANDTFGIIAEGIGPQEIIITLLNNLRMSERQIRLCSSIAMAIVAKACGTFTILPVLMNEYKTPDTNIKNGILKALAFMFEYIGEECINYVYHMVPMLEHALTDRNIVLRQTASTVVKSLAVSCKSCDREDAFIHFLNLLIPNIFETSPHAIERIRSAITSLRVTIGTDILMQYIWAGLTHPSTTVKESYFAVFNIIKEEEEERLVHCYPLNEVEELINVI